MLITILLLKSHVLPRSHSRSPPCVFLRSELETKKKIVAAAPLPPSIRDLSALLLYALPELGLPKPVIKLVIDFCNNVVVLDAEATALRAAMTAAIAKAATEFRLDSWNAECLLDRAQFSFAEAKLHPPAPDKHSMIVMERECMICYDQQLGVACTCSTFFCIECYRELMNVRLALLPPLCGGVCQSVLPEAILLRLLGDSGMARLRDTRLQRFCRSLVTAEHGPPSFVVRCQMPKCGRYIQVCA